MNQRLRDRLDREKVWYHVVQHGEAFTAQEVAERSHVRGDRLAKVVVLRQPDAGFLMVAIPAPARLDLGAVEALAGSRLELASEPEFRALFGDCEPGAMPAFGELYSMPLCVDESLAGDDIWFPAGTHHELVHMRWEDFARLTRPVLGRFTFHAVRSRLDAEASP
jgi:Ala-tRNA(Pro) deacylase